MNISDKQRFERLAFDVLRQHEPDLPTAQERHEDNPDFRIETPSGVLGIEVTEVDHVGNRSYESQRRMSALCDRIVSRAQTLTSEKGLTPLHCTVTFATDANPKKKDVAELAQRLAEVVCCNLPIDDDSKCTILDALDGLPHPIISARVTFPRIGKSGIWQRSVSYFVDEDCVDAFQSTIARKNSKFAHYSLSCHSCWLVLASTWWMGGLEPGPRALANCFDSQFDRLYFVDISGRQLFRLRGHAELS